MLPLAAHHIHEADPFLFQIGGFGIRYYGLAYLLGFVVAYYFLHRYGRAGRSLIPAGQLDSFVYWMFAGVFVGGRLGYFLLYTPGQLVEEPLSFFRVWDGGMASHGGFAGVILALWWFAHSRKVPMVHLGDLVVTVVPFGLLFGRIANYINGELWGRRSSVPWAVIFPGSGEPGQPVSAIAPRHPSQLYEAALEGGLLLAYLQWRFWRTDVTRTHPGRLAGEFLVGYAVVRAFCEFFREPDASRILGMTRGTFYSLFLIAGGIYLIVRPQRPIEQ